MISIQGCRQWAQGLAVALAGLIAVQPAGAFFEQVDTTGFYIAGSGSYTIMQDFRVNRVEGMDTAGSTRLFMDDGLGFAAAVGYDTSPFRVEAEFSYRSNDVDRVESAPPLPSLADARGDMSFMSAMGNLYYDAQVYPGTNFYFGAGLGASRVRSDVRMTEFDEVVVDPITGDTAVLPVAERRMRDRDWVLAYQFMLGVSHAMTPRLTANAGYRFFSTESLSFNGSRTRAPRLHILELGLRWNF